MTFPSRDAIEVEALRTDRYLEALLGGVPTAIDAGTTDGGVAVAAAHLTSGLVRVHPSFRFEEELSARLATAAAAMGATTTRRGPAPVVPFPSAAGAGGPEAAAAMRGAGSVGRFGPVALPVVALPLAADLGHLRAAGLATALGVDRLPAPLLLGGAIASGVSLAGAAVVGWHVAHRRARRPS